MAQEKWTVYRESTDAWETSTAVDGEFSTHAEALEEATRRNMAEEAERTRPERERHERFVKRFEEITGTRPA